MLQRLLALGLILVTPWVLAAIDRPQVSIQDDQYMLPLGWLNAQSLEPLELRGADARRMLDLPISARLKVEEAQLELIYTNSISLLPRSQLAVTLDEQVMAQVPLKAHQPDNGARILLPPQNLQPGYHQLGFRAAHHYTDECEDPSAPELYSQIHARQSRLLLRASRKPITPSLARLTDIFDRRLWLDTYHLTLIMPEPAMESATLLEAAGQATQAISGLFQYIPVVAQVTVLAHVIASPQLKDGRFPGLDLPAVDGLQNWDAILLGTREQLLPLIHPDIAARITEGFIGIYPADDDPSRTILVISGVTAEQVRQAATTLNLPGLILPERQEVLLSELKVDQGYHHLQLLREDEDGWNTLAKLGFKTTTMKGMYPRPASVEFWLSAHPHTFDPNLPSIDLELHLAYGAGFDKKSALNVFLNQQFVQAIPMADKNGEQLYRVKVRLPVSTLRIGANELRFIPSVIGEDVGGACEPIFTENLLITVFDDSRIQLPLVSDAMSLPDLGLLARTGLPYTRLADGQGTGIWLAKASPTTLSQALTLQAKLRQINRAPLLNLRMLTEAGATHDLTGLIVIGAAPDLPDMVRAEMSALLPGQRWQHINLGAFQPSLEATFDFIRWLEHPTQPLLDRSATPRAADAELRLDEGLGASAALVQYISPSRGYPVTVLTAESEKLLQKAGAWLVDNLLWSRMGGSAMLWSADGEVVAQADPPAREVLGARSISQWAGMSLSENPWVGTAMIVALILAVASLTWWLLRWRARSMGLDK